MLLVAAVILVAPALPAKPSAPPAYGRKLVAQYQLPLEAIERYAAVAAGAAPAEARREGSHFADAWPWVGPEQRAGDGRNPYTLVLTIDGSAQAAGEVFAQWQVGWEIQEESPGDRREVVIDVPGLVTSVKGSHQPVRFTTSSGPLSFRGERIVAPKLGLVYTRNLDVRDVRLEVWSGIAPFAWPVLPAWPELPASSKTLLALCMACILFGTAIRFWPHRAGGQATLSHLQVEGAKSSAAPASRDATPARPQATLSVAVQTEAPPGAAAAALALEPDHQACVLANLERVLQGRSAS